MANSPSIYWRVFLLSILIIQRGQKRLTPLGWFRAWCRQSIQVRYDHMVIVAAKIFFLKYFFKRRYCVLKKYLK